LPQVLRSSTQTNSSHAYKKTGCNFATSFLTLPALLNSPPKLLALQWLDIGDKVLSVEVLLSLTSTFLFGLLSFLSNLHDPPRMVATQLYLTAAVGTLGFAMYTRFLMWGVICKLQDKAAAAKKVKTDTILQNDGDRETHQLVREWGTWNMYRGILPLISALVGVGACVCHIEGK
jgi:hypothetical protein